MSKELPRTYKSFTEWEEKSKQIEYTEEKLLETCKRLSSIYKGHPVVVRADKETDYANVLNVIDICRKADIWQISFATDMNGNKEAGYDVDIAPTEIK